MLVASGLALYCSRFEGFYPALSVISLIRMRAILIYGKIAFAWRGGRAAEGACLENMFGSHQRGFESHPLRQADLSRSDSFSNCPCATSRMKEVATTKKWGGARVAEWARLLSECRL